jgi:NitT/TauT family transport system substrate-binding protein
MKVKRSISIAASLLLIATAAIACGSSEQKSGGTETSSSTGGASSSETSAPSGEDPSTSSVESSEDSSDGDTPKGDLRLYKYGSAGSMGDAPMFVAKELGYFEELGLNVEVQRLKAGPVIAQSLTTGQIDAGAVAAGATLYNAFTQGFPLKMVADRQSNRGEQGFGIQFLIRKDLAEGVDLSDDAQVAAMLKGTRLIESAKGSSVDLMTRDLLQRYGLSESDITVVESGYSEGIAAIAGGSIDGGFVIEPFASQSVQKGITVILPGATDVVPIGNSIVPLVFGQSLLDNTSDGEKFMLGFLRGAVYVNDAFFGSKENYDQVLQIVSEGSGVSIETLKIVQPQGIDPWNPLDLTFMDRLLNLDVELGTVPQKPNLEDYLDNSYIEKAVVELKNLGLTPLGS